MECTWANLEHTVARCQLCPLCAGRKNTVLGEGNRQGDVLFVGEAPGAQEDASGRPFVGPAGQLLEKMLAVIELTRDSVYIANVVKCRPPGNRIPQSEEVQACLGYLRAQFKLIAPRIIVCLGASAGKAILHPDLRITLERGIWTQRKNVWILATYHPSALLRDETGDKKRQAWQDMKALRSKMAELKR